MKTSLIMSSALTLLISMSSFASGTPQYNKNTKPGMQLLSLKCVSMDRSLNNYRFTITASKSVKYEENKNIPATLTIVKAAGGGRIGMPAPQRFEGFYNFEDVQASFVSKDKSLSLNTYLDELDQTTLTTVGTNKKENELRLDCNE